jgi:hypothetical protein
MLVARRRQCGQGGDRRCQRRLERGEREFLAFRGTNGALERARELAERGQAEVCSHAFHGVRLALGRVPLAGGNRLAYPPRRVDLAPEKRRSNRL